MLEVKFQIKKYISHFNKINFIPCLFIEIRIYAKANTTAANICVTFNIMVIYLNVVC